MKSSERDDRTRGLERRRYQAENARYRLADARHGGRIARRRMSLAWIRYQFAMGVRTL